MKNISTQEVNRAKAEISRLKKLKIRFSNDPEAVDDIGKLIKKHTLFISRAQEVIEDRKIRPLC